MDQKFYLQNLTRALNCILSKLSLKKITEIYGWISLDIPFKIDSSFLTIYKKLTEV